jgi:hypothetical protein
VTSTCFSVVPRAAQQSVKALNHIKLARLFVVSVFSVSPVLVMAEVPVLSPSGYGLIQFGQPLKVAEKI